MIIITATIPTTEANRDALIALCTAHSARSRAEPGCISHHIHADCEDPSRLFFHEEWQDAQALAAHFAVPESRDFVRQLTALVGHRPDMQICRAEAVSPADLG